MRLLHEIAIFQTVKSKMIISLFETVRLSVSISLRNLYNSLNSKKKVELVSDFNTDFNRFDIRNRCPSTVPRTNSENANCNTALVKIDFILFERL